MPSCDVVVIGTGPGGYVAAIRAAQRGAKVVAIEKAKLGGVCLNWGCIPTKTLIYTAHLYEKLQDAPKYGLKVDGLSLDLKALRKRKDTVVKANQGGIDRLFKAHGIELIAGDATIPEPGRVEVNGTSIECRAIIVATGSSSAEIPGLETDGERIITSTEALELTEVPERAAIIGAGAIGAEFATLWDAFGTKVTLIEMMDQVLPREDAEITKRVRASFERRGIDVRTGTTVKSMQRKGDTVHLSLSDGDKVEADIVLVAIGRKFHSDLVTDIGVTLGERGVILTDDRMETNVPGVYAIGDVVGRTMLAHGASAEGIVAAENAAGGDRRMDYRVVPACTFTIPEVASVGLTEQAAREQGYDVHIGRFDFAASGRAHTMGEAAGLVKIVGDTATDEILGVHIFGPEAGELIASAAMAMQLEATVEELAHTIHTHPTLSETLMEAAEDYFDAGIHTPPRKSRGPGRVGSAT